MATGGFVKGWWMGWGGGGGGGGGRDSSVDNFSELGGLISCGQSAPSCAKYRNQDFFHQDE